MGLLALLLLLFSVVAASSPPKQPHIVWFIMDDVGYADVSIRNRSNDIRTPFLDALADDGVLLDRYYTMPVCSPTRASQMLGRYAWKTGLQQYATLMPTTRARMAYDQPTVAELLRAANYSTHAVGKWHLGYANWKATPVERGFSSFRGYMQGEVDYYNKSFAVPKKFLKWPSIHGLDWWADKEVVRNESGIYNKDIYDETAERIIASHDASEPLFLYYAHQLAHVPLDDPPALWFKGCEHIENPLRKVYCAMMQALDDSLERLVASLKARGMWDDTLLVVATDNGGMPNVYNGFPDSAGSNYPLRAGKGLCFEGGVRGVAVVNGGVLPAAARGTVNSDLISAVDWYATSVRMASDEPLPAGIDALDLWPSLTGGQRLGRSVLPLNLNYHIQFPNSGTQVGLINADNIKLVIQQVKGPVLNYDGFFDNDLRYEPPPPNPTPGFFLFNLTADPEERHNLFNASHPLTQQLLALADSIRAAEYMPPQKNSFDPLGAPELHDGVWKPFEL